MSCAARAERAEAILQYVVNNSNGTTANKKRMFSTMRQAFEQKQPNIETIAQKNGPYMLDPALCNFTAETMPRKGTEASLWDQYPRIGDAKSVNAAQRVNHKLLVTALNQHMSKIDQQEGFLDFLSPVASSAVNVVSSDIGALAKALGGGKSSSDQAPTPADTLQAHMETLCHRALMAEAALEVALEISPENHEEGFFEDVTSAIKNIGSTVIKVAPTVVKAVGAIVKSVTESSTPVDVDGVGGS